MTFTENLDASASNLRLVDSSGAVVAEGGTVDSGNPKEMTLALPNLAPGAYTIRWTTKSALDGDVARGTTTFTATAATPPPASPTPSTEPSTASAESSRAASSAPSGAPSDSPLASSGGTGTSTSSTDTLIPIVVALVVLGGLGAWLLRRRSRQA